MAAVWPGMAAVIRLSRHGLNYPKLHSGDIPQEIRQLTDNIPQEIRQPNLEPGADYREQVIFCFRRK